MINIGKWWGHVPSQFPAFLSNAPDFFLYALMRVCVRALMCGISSFISFSVAKSFVPVCSCFLSYRLTSCL
jgi:hypothetical protein